MRRRRSERIDLELRHGPSRQLCKKVVDGKRGNDAALGVADEDYFRDSWVNEEGFELVIGQPNAKVVV